MRKKVIIFNTCKNNFLDICKKYNSMTYYNRVINAISESDPIELDSFWVECKVEEDFSKTAANELSDAKEKFINSYFYTYPIRSRKLRRNIRDLNSFRGPL